VVKEIIGGLVPAAQGDDPMENPRPGRNHSTASSRPAVDRCRIDAGGPRTLRIVGEGPRARSSRWDGQRGPNSRMAIRGTLVRGNGGGPNHLQGPTAPGSRFAANRSANMVELTVFRQGVGSISRAANTTLCYGGAFERFYRVGPGPSRPGGDGGLPGLRAIGSSAHRLHSTAAPYGSWSVECQGSTFTRETPAGG